MAYYLSPSQLAADRYSVVMPPHRRERKTPRHLGIPLKQPSLPMQARVGVRYWNFDHKDRLAAPISSGINWAPGLNRGLTSGLYCFHYDKGLTKTNYFNIPNCKLIGGGPHVPLGGIAYWMPDGGQSPQAGGMVVAKYAAVACLVKPKKCSDKDFLDQLERAADFYRVEIVEHKEIKQATRDFVKNRLADFHRPPHFPLFDLTSQALDVVDPGLQRWDFIPRGHRSRTSPTN